MPASHMKTRFAKINLYFGMKGYKGRGFLVIRVEIKDEK